MTRPRRWMMVVAAGILLGIVALPVAYIGSGAWTRDRNLRRAEAHLPILRRAIANDPRFADVEFGEDYRGQGRIRVVGRIGSEADWRVLHDLVMATEPPLGVVYGNFEVGGERFTGLTPPWLADRGPIRSR